MPYFVADNNARVTGTLAAAVAASGGTFTVNYPSGTAQVDFNTGLAGPNSVIHINDNDRYALGASGLGLTFGASNITVTNNSTVIWPAGATFTLILDRQDGNEAVVITIPIMRLQDITTTGDVVSAVRPGIDGVIEYAEFVVSQPVTTAARAATLGVRLNASTDLTSMTAALTSANCTPLGAVIPFGLPTANQAITRRDSLTIRSSAVTAFAEGSGFILLRVRKTIST